MTRTRHSIRHPAQRGVASLIVVMVLFFVVSLMAAYASRNLIFDQKTSANQARSTLAFEAADAGVEWALAQLNGSEVDDDCVVQSGAQSFQVRYTSIAADGTITPLARSAGLEPELWPTCVFDGAVWQCKCPQAATATPANPAGAGPFPAFRVWTASREPVTLNSPPWLPEATLYARLMPIRSVGCTRLPATPATPTDPTCLSFLPRNDMGDGSAIVQAMVALRSGLAVPPAAAVTARGTVTPPAPAPTPLLSVVNEDPHSGGFTVSSGVLVANQAWFDAKSVPGTPASYSFADGDLRLQALTTVAPPTTPPAAPALTPGERMFVSIFGVNRAVYREQPGLRLCPSPCAFGTLQSLYNDNPHRVIWAEGNVTLTGNLGSAAAPLLLVVNGASLTLDPGITAVGFIYVVGTTVAPATMSTSTVNVAGVGATIQGALAAEGDLLVTAAGIGPLSVIYDRAVLELLRTSYGSWARVPGGWRDFKG